jgi:maltose O-acetyltransferase
MPWSLGLSRGGMNLPYCAGSIGWGFTRAAKATGAAVVRSSLDVENRVRQVSVSEVMERPAGLMRSGSQLVFEWALHRCPPFVGARAIAAALRFAGARIARSTIFWGMPRLTGEGERASRLQIGELCGLNFGCHFELDAPITLAPHVAVGHEVMFLTRTRDSRSAERRGKPGGALPITIGEGAWIGSRCTILPGVTVGAGSVIGASVVVRENVPPNTLLAGNRKISLAKWR